MPPRRGKSRGEHSISEGGARRKGRGRGSAEKLAGDGLESDADALISEAGRRKQAAERRGPGGASTGHLQASVGSLEAALALPLDPGQQLTARFELGEALLLLSDSILADARAAAGSPLSGTWFRTKMQAAEVEKAAYKQALRLARQAHLAFDMRDLAGLPADVSHEVAVNAANALVVQAELAQELGEGGGELLAQAEAGYRTALTQTPHDVEVLTNLGDVCIKRGELQVPPTLYTWQQQTADSGQVLTPQPCMAMQGGLDERRGHAWDQAEPHYQRGVAAYAEAHSWADARGGDDVAGLLHNWGLGLLSWGKRSPGVEEEEALYRRAAEKFREEGQLQPSSLLPKLALAEVLAVMAERSAFLPGGQGQVSMRQYEDGRGGGAPSSAGGVGVGGQALQLLAEALEHGFLAALQVDASHVEARLGEGDVHLAAGKQLRARGEVEGAGREWLLSRAAYENALIRIRSAGPASELGFGEQCDVLYNLACATCLAGDEKGAAMALRQLAEAGALCGSDLAADEDLAALRGRDWFDKLLSTT